MINTLIKFNSIERTRNIIFIDEFLLQRLKVKKRKLQTVIICVRVGDTFETQDLKEACYTWYATRSVLYLFNLLMLKRSGSNWPEIIY